MFQIGQPPNRIDILQIVDGVSFKEAWRSRIDIVIVSIPTHVIASEVLIQNMLAAG